MLRVTIPQIFENMEEATIGRWLVSAGDTVPTDGPLCELITEKTTLDLTAEAGGILLHIIAPEKAVIPPGYVVALIGAAGASLDTELAEVTAQNTALLAKKGEVATPDAAPALKVPVFSPPSSTPAAPAAAGSRLRATPAARRAAKDVGVDLEAVAAKFPGKVLGEDDVKAFVA